MLNARLQEDIAFVEKHWYVYRDNIIDNTEIGSSKQLWNSAFSLDSYHGPILK